MRRAGLAVLVLSLLIAPAWGAGSSAPMTVVKSAVDKVIHVLKERKDQTRLSSQDRAAIRDAVAPYFDFQEMAKRSLGVPWKKISPQQQQRYVDVFRQLLERSYGSRLGEYTNQEVEYGTVTMEEERAVADTIIVDKANQRQIPVQYTLYQKNGGWWIYDIKIEGVSLVSTFRSSFSKIYNESGYSGLMKHMEDKLEQLKQEEQPG